MVRMLAGQRMAGRIVETEAYVGVRDRACHSFKGRRTPRNESMYASAGTFYVYFTYGMHFCCNVVCGEVDEPIAVLIRALEPVDGINQMRTHRDNRQRHALRETDLCSGPARLCQALGIARPENGLDLITSPNLWIEPASEAARLRDIRCGPRIGISTGNVWATRLLRFGLRDHPCISVPFLATRRAPRIAS